MGILEVFKASVERPIPVLHHLFSQYVGHVQQLSNYFTIIQQCRPNFHSLANCFWEDNVVWFVFAKRFDELGIWNQNQNQNNLYSTHVVAVKKILLYSFKFGNTI